MKLLLSSACLAAVATLGLGCQAPANDDLADVGGSLQGDGKTDASALDTTLYCRLAQYATFNDSLDEWVTGSFVATADPSRFSDDAQEIPAIDVRGPMYKHTSNPADPTWWRVDIVTAGRGPRVGFVVFTRAPGTSHWTRLPASTVGTTVADHPVTLHADYYDSFQLEGGKITGSIPKLGMIDEHDVDGAHATEYGFFPIPVSTTANSLAGDGAFQLSLTTQE